jgi:hypothetical protein
MSAALTCAKDAIQWSPPFPYAEVLSMCVAQVADGEGEERHGGGLPFIRQPWVAVQFSHSPGFLTGQSEKKWLEAHGSIIASSDERYVSEVVGAIVYALMALIALVDPEVAAQKLHPRRARLSAHEWLCGVWPTESEFEAYQRMKATPESPAFALQDRAILIRLIQFRIFLMAAAVRTRASRMKPPLAAQPMTLPVPELKDRVG